MVTPAHLTSPVRAAAASITVVDSASRGFGLDSTSEFGRWHPPSHDTCQGLGPGWVSFELPSPARGAIAIKNGPWRG